MSSTHQNSSTMSTKIRSKKNPKHQITKPATEDIFHCSTDLKSRNYILPCRNKFNSKKALKQMQYLSFSEACSLFQSQIYWKIDPLHNRLGVWATGSRKLVYLWKAKRPDMSSRDPKSTVHISPKEQKPVKVKSLDLQKKLGSWDIT